MQKLNKGACFGEISFFTGQARSFKIRSTDFSTLLIIKREDFRIQYYFKITLKI